MTAVARHAKLAPVTETQTPYPEALSMSIRLVGAAASTLALALLLPTAAHADDGASDAALAPTLRAMVFDGVCDALPSDSDVDCDATPARCTMRRSDGRPFAPRFDWGSAYWAIPPTALYLLDKPARASGHPEPSEGYDPLAWLANLPAPDRVDSDLNVRRLSEAQINWVVEHLAPRPDDVICGVPARTVYRTLAKKPADVFTGALLHLARAGAFKGFDRDHYLATQHDPKGRYTRMCARFAGKRVDGEAMFKQFACGFWLRRAFIGQLEAVAHGWAAAVGRFEPAVGKRIARAVPRPRPAAKAPKTISF